MLLHYKLFCSAFPFLPFLLNCCILNMYLIIILSSDDNNGKEDFILYVLYVDRNEENVQKNKDKQTSCTILRAVRRTQK